METNIDSHVSWQIKKAEPFENRNRIGVVREKGKDCQKIYDESC